MKEKIALQEMMLDIIFKLVNIKNIFKYKGDTLYGVTNYIAKHSLANDKYYISIDAYKKLK